MKEIVHKIFGKPLAPNWTGVEGSSCGRLYINKAVFFNRKDVQKAINYENTN
jgi:hypothetical protein